VNIVISIAGLAFLVLIHEAGHFFVARAVGMRPRKFYLFFPPALVKRVHKGIEYGIGTIPLGGYVKIPGMHRPAAGDVDAHLGRAIDESPWLGRHAAPLKHALEQGDLEEARRALPDLEAAVQRADLSDQAGRSAERGLAELDDALSPDAYWRAASWKRIAVIFAGPATNLLFAVAMLAVVYAVGVAAGATRTIDRITSDSPAEQIGLRHGDQIVAISGQETDRFREVSERIRASRGRPITITVLRDGQRVTLGPVSARLIDGRYRLGFVPEPYMKSYPAGKAITKAFDQTGHVTVAIGKSLGGIVTGSSRHEVSSAVGIVEQSSQVVAQGFRYYLGVLALISLSLALLNLLPLLPLDGGHIAFSIAEKIRGRAIPRAAYERASVVGIALVLLLFVIGLSNDINRLRNG
jgi:regulator of sigma E protease